MRLQHDKGQQLVVHPLFLPSLWTGIHHVLMADKIAQVLSAWSETCAHLKLISASKYRTGTGQNLTGGLFSHEIPVANGLLYVNIP